MGGGSSTVSPVPDTPLRAANRAYADQRWADRERLVQEVLAAQPEPVQAWRLAFNGIGTAHPGWTNVTSLNGGDNKLEDSLHFNANVVIFG